LFKIKFKKIKASGFDNKDIAQFLIEKGADINSQDYLGRTPLIIGNLFYLILDT
jgi:hypothetical protein